jgi:hypothetical protein
LFNIILFIIIIICVQTATSSKRNAKRNAQRNAEDGKHQQALASAHQASVSGKLAMYTKLFQSISSELASVYAATFASPSLQDLVQATRDLHSLTSLTNNPTLWNQFLQQDMLPFWDALRTNPLQINVKHWLASGVFCNGDTCSQHTSSSSATFYIRVAEFDSLDIFYQKLSKYMSLYPAEIPYSAFLLSAAGCPSLSITTAASAALSHVYQQYDQSSWDFDTPAAAATSQVQSLPISTDLPITLAYIGYSIAGSDKSRVEHDLKSQHRRFPNLSSSLDLNWSTFHLPHLTIPASSTLDIRTNPLIGDTEFVLISALRGLAANSAKGGWRCSYRPTIQHQQCISNALASSRSSQSIPWLSHTGLSEHISLLFEDESAFWRLHLSSKGI